MFIGFSKTLGRAFRVGAGTKIGGRPPSLSDLKKAKAADLLSRIRQETQAITGRFLVAHNIEPSVAASKGYDVDAMLASKGFADTAKKFNQTVSSIIENIQKYEYGELLVSNRRDTLIDLIFELRKSEPDTQQSKLTDLADEVQKSYQKKITIALCVCALLIFLTVTAPLAIIYIPIHIFLKKKRNAAYRTRANELILAEYFA